MTEKEMKKMSLLAEVACDYYERGLDQNQIAERLCLSRSRVSRLIKEAIDSNIVSFTVNYRYTEYARHYEMEERLCSRLGLKQARVLNNRGRNPAFIQQDVAQLAAEYTISRLKKNMVIGTSWGTTIRDVANSLYLPTKISPLSVVQLMGSVPCKTPYCTPQEITATIADHLNCHADFINMPLFIENDYVRQEMQEDVNNKKILKKGMFSDIILAGISDMESITKKELWLGYMTEEMLQELLGKGAVGAIFARFYNKEGKLIDCSWNRKCVSISFGHIKEAPEVIAVAASIKKAQAILAATKNGLINTLITDGSTATAILENFNENHLQFDGYCHSSLVGPPH